MMYPLAQHTASISTRAPTREAPLRTANFPATRAARVHPVPCIARNRQSPRINSTTSSPTTRTSVAFSLSRCPPFTSAARAPSGAPAPGGRVVRLAHGGNRHAQQGLRFVGVHRDQRRARQKFSSRGAREPASPEAELSRARRLHRRVDDDGHVPVMAGEQRGNRAHVGRVPQCADLHRTDPLMSENSRWPARQHLSDVMAARVRFEAPRSTARSKAPPRRSQTLPPPRKREDRPRRPPRLPDRGRPIARAPRHVSHGWQAPSRRPRG